MKKYGKFLYLIIFIILIVTLGFLFYKVSRENKSNENENQKNKVFSEIKYLESKFIELFNDVNNINFDNYKISLSSSQKDEQENIISGNSSESSNSDDKSKESGGMSSGSDKSQSSSDNKQSFKNNQQYDLKDKGILTNDSVTDWNKIKNDVELIYNYLYTTTIDLYQLLNDQDDIIKFNKEYDNLTKAVKEENKNETLIELSKLYEYFPKFLEKDSDNQKEIIILKTKSEIFKAYSIIDYEDWEKMNKYINNASQEFMVLVTDIKYQKNVNQYNLNKIYIIINEMQNAIELKDREVFLIKYKNALEELKNV